jgi:hypothetical protein
MPSTFWNQNPEGRCPQCQTSYPHHTLLCVIPHLNIAHSAPVHRDHWHRTSFVTWWHEERHELEGTPTHEVDHGTV